MSNHAIICTREEPFTETLTNLVSFYESAGYTPHITVGGDSIFTAYKNALDKIKPSNNDIIVFCHDDIEILLQPNQFKTLLETNLTGSKAGFVGPAGAAYLSEDAIWWNKEIWGKGGLGGTILHGKSLNDCYTTFFGPFRHVAVLDGVFLAAKGKMLKKLDFTKPAYFDGEWDFYDIFITNQARGKKFKNKTIPILMLHSSIGEVEGRDSWLKNREAFIANNKLPISV